MNTHISYSYPHSQPIHSASISHCPFPNVDFKFTFCNPCFPAVTLAMQRDLDIVRSGIYMLGYRNVCHLALELGYRKGSNEYDMFKCGLVFGICADPSAPIPALMSIHTIQICFKRQR